MPLERIIFNNFLDASQQTFIVIKGSYDLRLKEDWGYNYLKYYYHTFTIFQESQRIHVFQVYFLAKFVLLLLLYLVNKKHIQSFKEHIINITNNYSNKFDLVFAKWKSRTISLADININQTTFTIFGIFRL